MHKSTLFRKVQLLGIDLPEQDGRSRQPSGEGVKVGSLPPPPRQQG